MKIVARMRGAALAALLGLVPAAALGQCCGDCDGNGVVTVDELVTAVHRALTGCSDDRICSTESCTVRLTTCQTDLTACQAQEGGQRFPASGQTTAYGPDSDGAVHAGAALSYTDNGDGTITDNDTGLIWEKKDDSGGIHDVDNTYTWSGPSLGSTNVMDGTIATEFLATLNAGAGFAGHTDWRIPNIKELQSIVNYEIEYPGPVVDPVFHRAGTCTACSDVTAASCSCTSSYYYWSSTADRRNPNFAWDVLFSIGGGSENSKYYDMRARAVRGGL